jgi:hypothetical protein
LLYDPQYCASSYYVQAAFDVIQHGNSVLLFFRLALVLGATSMTINRDASSTIEAGSSWNFLGCYSDSVSARALPNGEAVLGGTNAMTNELCQTTCLAAGFSMAGTEYAR